MDKKYQVFISSTYRDLPDERRDALESVLDLAHIPSGMELFQAADEEQFSYIKKIIEQCDYYVLIIGGRYGSVDSEGNSFTEKEYLFALEKGKIILAFLYDDIKKLPYDRVETDPNLAEKLRIFREKVSSNRLVVFWKSREDLRAKLIISLSKSFGEYPQVGWVRANRIASDSAIDQINILQKKITDLADENKNLKLSLKPKIENLARMDSSFTIDYSYSRTESYSVSSVTERKQIELSWGRIFSIVAPEFQSPHTDAQINKSLSAYLRQHKHNNGYGFIFLDTTINTIKYQYDALGLWKVYVGKSTQGGMAEFIQLTDYGRKTLVDILAVRE